MQARYRAIALSAGSGIGTRIIAQGALFFALSLLRNRLDRDAYGVWAILLSLLAWIGIADFGILNGLMNTLSGCLGRGEHARARAVLSTSVWMMAGICAVVSTLVALLPSASLFRGIYSLPGIISDRSLQYAFVALAIAFSGTMLASAWRQFFFAYQKGYIHNIATSAGTVAGMAALWITVQRTGELHWLLLAWSVPNWITIAICHILSRRACQGVAFAPRRFDVAEARTMLHVSAPLFAFQLGALLVNQCQTIVLARSLGPAAAGDFALVMNLYMLPLGLIGQVTSSFPPIVREAHESGDAAWCRTAIRRFIGIRMGLAAVAALAFVICGQWLLELWLRGGAPGLPPTGWAILAVLLLVSVWSTAHADLLMVFDRAKSLLVPVFLNGATTAAATLILAPRMGLTGAFLATALFTALVLSWWMPAIFARFFDAPDRTAIPRTAPMPSASRSEAD